ncbi:DUF7661 family protein [Thalassotalea mangrovi]|uniref:DUF7661 domain-containing protein n=1 Tax=Thalassotalea mangrovi TaxID=2572245 RepID=A0A4U1B735_9GAMM|nr:hypothetical protein [Thalassotalea mangrovi]TKB45745.1 hypothetical protein E8M12_07400 [Thalassotalea mangrovi]
MIKFDVFGTLMSVLRNRDEWQLFVESETSIRRRVYDVVIPEELREDELAGYLDDIYHEYASEKHPSVKQIS